MSLGQRSFCEDLGQAILGRIYRPMRGCDQIVFDCCLAGAGLQQPRAQRNLTKDSGRVSEGTNSAPSCVALPVGGLALPRHFVGFARKHVDRGVLTMQSRQRVGT